ncbi:hypothetical protein BWQ96_04313 [Gracilariopsis chorda]|uniref:Methyltransferase domain-containing protein n=1 Tax=Gracilariopsis chorda TaxID=448386 RepID=A0A2V3IUR4_9FLOR|nr:hypothetical protein BWQ96_04313 [Gracilariopsis chorda]|eukprot:PXF45878.1 hypothetical protein BWQ96_04313 [Gracilariopsis chorda]
MVRSVFHSHSSPYSFILPTPPPSKGLEIIAPHVESLCSLLRNRVYVPKAPSIFDHKVEEYLKNLSDPVLHHIETHGATETLLGGDAPPYLRCLASLAFNLSQFFPGACQDFAVDEYQQSVALHPQKGLPRTRIRSAKRHQIAVVTKCTQTIISQMRSDSIERIVDMGAGHSHLSANFGEKLGLPILAIDRDSDLLRTSKKLYSDIPNLSWHQACIGTPREDVQIGTNDMLVGLHACGSLGDQLIEKAVQSGVSAVFLVSCCLQKLRPALPFRYPLSDVVVQDKQLLKLLKTERRLLGVTNRSRNASQTSTQGRVTRYALRKLLGDHGLHFKHGDEVHGLSRHAFKHGLKYVSEKIAEIHQINLRLSEEEAGERMEAAAVDYRAVRALSVPRAVAGEILEMAIVLDRAARLEEQFHTVRTMRVWPESVSVRNQAIAAWN